MLFHCCCASGLVEAKKKASCSLRNSICAYTKKISKITRRGFGFSVLQQCAHHCLWEVQVQVPQKRLYENFANLSDICLKINFPEVIGSSGMFPHQCTVCEVFRLHVKKLILGININAQRLRDNSSFLQR